MKKNWKLIYLICGSITFVVISLVCLLGFYRGVVKSVNEKYNFESIYINTDFDFIIPAPSYEQVGTLETDDNNGIKIVTPYYAFNTSIKIEGKSVQSNVVLLDDALKVEYTPYNSKRIVSGSFSCDDNVAIVDEAYLKKNNCSLGESVTLSIDSINYSFTIVAVAEDNTSFDSSIALIISNEQSKNINENSFHYGAAYVTSSDYAQCKAYLENAYRPLGRLKDRSEFTSDDAYNTHVSNFYNADWSQEVTDMVANYATLSLKYENVNSNALRDTVIESAIYLVVILVFNIVVLFLPSEKKMFAELLTKKKGSIKDVIYYNLKGNATGLAVTCVAYAVCMIFIDVALGAFRYFALIAVYSFLPIAVAAAGFILNSIIGYIIIKKSYSR